MKINKNIIAKDLDSPLQLIEIEIEDGYITGKVLVGSGFYVKGKVYKMHYINFVLTTDKTKEDPIVKVGTKLVACYNLMLGNKFHLTNLKEYEVTAVDDFNSTFIIIDDQNEQHIFNFSDVPNVWFNFCKPKKDPIVKQVTDKFKARSKVGIEKYGTTLEENNTDDFLEHLQQELMDATLYIEKLKGQSIDLTSISTDDLAIELSKRGCRITQVHYSEL